jgi:hypothetical protein
VIVLTLGCAKSRLETDYGTSYNLQKFNQTLNPDAEKNLAPVTGLNAQAAQYNGEKYQKGFEKQSETSKTYQISVGSMGGQ